MKNIKIVSIVLLMFLFGNKLFSEETIVINATRSEEPTSLWIEKGSQVQFSVSGSWTMWDSWEPVDYNGHTSFKKVNNYNLGALIGRIEGGKNFEVKDKTSFTSTNSGLLLLFPNRGSYAHLNASGSLTVIVEGAKTISKNEADKLSGWDLEKLDTARNLDYLTTAEKDVILLMNKARNNPPLFAKQYLETHKASGGYAKECYDEMLLASPMEVLQSSKALFLAAKDHAVDMGKKGKTGHNGSDGSSMGSRINRYGTWNSSISENCSYGFNDPMGIVLQLLIDDGVPSRGHRKNILNIKSKHVGVSIQPHTRYGSNCVQDFAASIEEK